MLNKAQDDDLVMNLVKLALARPEEQRQAYIKSACAGDAELFNHVWNYVQAEQRMKGFLLETLYSLADLEHPFEPGELLDDRFRIVREVAQGGMGIVYEAMDEKLERRIALKCGKVGFRKRLPPEVRHATYDQPLQCLQDFRDPHGFHRTRRDRFSHYGVSGRRDAHRPIAPRAAAATGSARDCAPNLRRTG